MKTTCVWRSNKGQKYKEDRATKRSVKKAGKLAGTNFDEKHQSFLI